MCAGGKHEVKLLADAAFWMKEAYEISIPIVERKKIGIGLIRGNSLQGYGVNFVSKQWIKLICRNSKMSFRREVMNMNFSQMGLPADTKLGKKGYCVRFICRIHS